MIAPLLTALSLWLAPPGHSLAPVRQAPASRILIVPFDTPPRDTRSYWLGEAVASLLTDDLESRGLNAITRSAREQAYEQLHLPPNAVLSRATVIKVGEIVGASQVVVGDASVDGDYLVVRVRPIRIDVGRADVEITERGALGEIFAIVQRAAARAVPGGNPPGPQATASLQAFEQYIKGLIAEKPATQAEFLEAALRADPRYAKARFALWEVRTALGDYAAALAAVRPIDPASPAGSRARFLAATSQIALKQYEEAFTTLKALQQTDPDAAILNNLGIVQIRRLAAPDTGKPAYFLTKAVEASPEDPDLLFNLGYAYALDRDPQAAIYWLRETVRRNPEDADAHYVLAAELDSAGSTVEAARERELATQLSAKYAERRSEALPKGLERVRQDLESRRSTVVDQAVVSTTQRDQRDLAQFHLDRARRLYDQEQDREAMSELRRVVFLSPYEAEAHLLIGRLDLRGGRPLEAVDALKISIWSRDTAPARIALAEAYLRLKDTAAARTHAQRALALDPGSAEARAMLERIGPGHP